MIADKPYEIDHVPPHLHKVFDGKVPPGQKGDARERENNFLTRALAAFAIAKLANCNPDEAAASVVDGGGDGGIDAVYYTPTSNTLWLVQSKFVENGRSEPELGEVSKFKDGVGDLLCGKWTTFEKNPLWVKLLPQVKKQFEDPSLRVRAVLVYSGINAVSDGRLELFEALESRYNHSDDYFRFSTYGLVTVHDWISGADEQIGVSKVELEILKPGWVTEPYQTIYGQVRVADLVALYASHGNKLVAANLRHYKGRTSVNKQIQATLESEPQHFFYLNNGLTAYCHRLEIATLDRANSEKKKITAKGFSIVNGAQTLGSIAKSKETSDGVVFLKVISLELCTEEVAFARRITESTNFQNQINLRDFVALDEQHDRIAHQLRIDGVHYHYKEADDVPDSDDSNFTLDDAATALACLERDATCELCATLLSNRKAIWSAQTTFLKLEPHQTLCQYLFRPERSARTIWRAVQVRRIVIKRLNDERPATGTRRAFFENARWLVLSLLFLSDRLEHGSGLQLTPEEQRKAGDKAVEIADAIWRSAQGLGFISTAEPYDGPRHFRSVFASAEDCKSLKAGALKILNEKAKSTTPSQLMEGTK